MRLGFFGGSFDPPHLGHTAAARAAAEAFDLDEVVFAPTGRQPLKEVRVSTPFKDRLAMVRLACVSQGRVRGSAIDGPRENGEANYTVDALQQLQMEYSGAEVFGIVGMDAFLQMPKWKEPEKLRKMAEWIVVTRPGYEAGVASDGGVHLLETVHVDVSATMLRDKLGRGEDCRGWVAGAVLEYIGEHRLYRHRE